MYVRCGACRASYRLALGEHEATTTCQACGEEYALRSIGELGATPSERYLRALAYAREHAIDLASAYSVLLGIVSLEDARSLQEGASGFAKPASPRRMTVGPAVDRGDRVARASALARQHRLPMKLAFDVVDNKLTLRAALDAPPTVDLPPVVRPAPREDPRIKLAVVAAGVIVGGCLVAYWSREPAARSLLAPVPRSSRAVKTVDAERAVEATAAAVTPALAQATTDAEGRLTRIVDSDPGGVLGGYCAAEAVDPIGIREAPVAKRGVRLGVLRRAGDAREYAIWIRLDQRTGKWFAGNGQDPIQVQAISEADLQGFPRPGAS